MDEQRTSADAGGNRRGLSRALIAVPAREDDRMWPVGSTVLAGTQDVRDEIDAVGDCDPTELKMPLPVGMPAHACLLVWEGELDEDEDGAIWRDGAFRKARAEELAALQDCSLEFAWGNLQEAAK